MMRINSMGPVPRDYRRMIPRFDFICNRQHFHFYVSWWKWCVVFHD